MRPTNTGWQAGGRAGEGAGRRGGGQAWIAIAATCLLAHDEIVRRPQHQGGHRQPGLEAPACGSRWMGGWMDGWMDGCTGSTGGREQAGCQAAKRRARCGCDCGCAAVTDCQFFVAGIQQCMICRAPLITASQPASQPSQTTQPARQPNLLPALTSQTAPWSGGCGCPPESGSSQAGPWRPRGAQRPACTAQFPAVHAVHAARVVHAEWKCGEGGSGRAAGPCHRHLLPHHPHHRHHPRQPCQSLTAPALMLAEDGRRGAQLGGQDAKVVCADAGLDQPGHLKHDHVPAEQYSGTTAACMWRAVTRCSAATAAGTGTWPISRRSAAPRSRSTARPQRSHSAATAQHPSPLTSCAASGSNPGFQRSTGGAVRTARPGGTAAAGRCRPRPSRCWPPSRAPPAPAAVGKPSTTQTISRRSDMGTAPGSVKEA